GGGDCRAARRADRRGRQGKGVQACRTAWRGGGKFGGRRGPHAVFGGFAGRQDVAGGRKSHVGGVPLRRRRGVRQCGGGGRFVQSSQRRGGIGADIGLMARGTAGIGLSHSCGCGRRGVVHAKK